MSETVKELSAAMAKAFGEIKGALKNKRNAHLKYGYADLSSIVEAIKPAIAQHGIWFYQVIHAVQGCAAVETIIMHSSGESLSCGIVTVPLSKNDAQGYGAGLTYARKYSLTAAFGVAQEDELDEDSEEVHAPQRREERAPVSPVKPIPTVEDSLTRVMLINELVKVTKIEDPLFMENIDRIERFCADEGKSFCEELRRRIATPEATIARFVEYKAAKELKKKLDKPAS